MLDELAETIRQKEEELNIVQGCHMATMDVGTSDDERRCNAEVQRFSAELRELKGEKQFFG